MIALDMPLSGACDFPVQGNVAGDDRLPAEPLAQQPGPVRLRRG